MGSEKCLDSCRTLPASRQRAAVFLAHQVHRRQIEVCHRLLQHAPARLHPQPARLPRRHRADPPLHHAHPLPSPANITIPIANIGRPHRLGMTLADPLRLAYASCLRRRTCVRRSLRRTLSSFSFSSSCPFCGLSQSQTVPAHRHYPSSPSESVLRRRRPRHPFAPHFLHLRPHRGRYSTAQ